MKHSLTTSNAPLCRHFTLGAISALLFASPAMGAIILTNGNFSSGTTGWSTDANFNQGGLFTVSGGAATASAGSATSLYQKASDTLLNTATVSFNYTLNSPATANIRNLDLRFFAGTPSGANPNGVFFQIGNTSTLSLNGTTFDISATPIVTGTNYVVTLNFSGLDGVGGATGQLTGSLFDGTNTINFNASGADWAAFDGLSFRHGSNWTGQSHTLDNIVVVPEPATTLLGGLGALALLRRRRK